jgi:hypothetical protein
MRRQERSGGSLKTINSLRIIKDRLIIMCGFLHGALYGKVKRSIAAYPTKQRATGAFFSFRNLSDLLQHI